MLETRELFSARFANESLTNLLAAFASTDPAPGSGSAAAMIGALAARMTQGHATRTATDESLLPIRDEAKRLVRLMQRHGEALLNSVDEDAAAFAPVVHLRVTRRTETDRIRVELSIWKEIEALRRTIAIPLDVTKRCIEVAESAEQLLQWGHRASRGEAYTAALSALAAAASSLAVARINIDTVDRRMKEVGARRKDHAWVAEMERTTASLTAATNARFRSFRKRVRATNSRPKKKRSR